MDIQLQEITSPIFEGIAPEDKTTMLRCIGYCLAEYRKGEVVSLEKDQVRNVGLLLSGSVDMVKEDAWGNRTMLVRMRKGEIFGETFACGKDSSAQVSFLASEDSRVAFLPFHRVMHSCTNACPFHHQLIVNLVGEIAAKNRDLMYKVEIISRKTLREKIMTYLSYQWQQQGSRYFEIPLGRVELADYLCADRSALTRELSHMKQDGLIDFDHNCFRIL